MSFPSFHRPMQTRFLPDRPARSLLLIVLLCCSADAFLFYLHPNEKRCFSEAYAPNTKVLGEYTVATGKGHMPVDITVTIQDRKTALFTRNNIDHGKFAFVIPYAGSDATHVKVSEMHRKIAQAMGAHAKKQLNAMHHRRRLLAAADEHDHIHDDHAELERPQHDDHYDYEDDFDLDDYDGIDDEELEKDIETNIKTHRGQDPDQLDAASDDERENQLFKTIKFEVCISSDGAAQRGVEKRRVRLIVHKGNAAHDYTRLAKKEHLSHLEVSLRRISDDLHELLSDLDRAKRMEDVLRAMNEKINRRVAKLAVVSFLILLAVGVSQALYTKRFFKHKKIL